MFGGQHIPEFHKYFQREMDIDVNSNSDPQTDIEIDQANINHAFLEELGEQNFSRRSFEKWERVMHSHGADLEALFQLRY